VEEAQTEPAAEEEASDEAEDGSVRGQNATLDSSELPAQTFALDGLRMQISSAYRAPSLPDLTLGPNSVGEWVVLLLEATNWSQEPATLDMTAFRLAPVNDIAAEIAPDSASAAVAAYLGLEPRLRPGESTVLAPGGYQPLSLVFSVPAGLGDLALLAGDETIALADAFANQSGKELTRIAAPPALVQGTVVEVVDGQTVTIEAGGETTTVAYYGLRSIAPEACFSAEAAKANGTLTEGQTVYLERQRRNRSESTTYLRDVWVPNASGHLELVAAALVAEGAGVPDPSSPDIRFAGWLAGEALVAQSSGAGFWSACGGQA
jgi:endonuclease YncB( thermonuclease family)